jgi:hypothetical protein
VTHRDMFTAEEATWVLPTLNSNVIESGLHRIPNISRFFLYFNNDMLVGRKMSFFDLFRPLSPPRQLLEMADLVRGGTLQADAVYTPDDASERRLLFFESIFNSDGYTAAPRRSLLAFAAASVLPPALCARTAEREVTGRWVDRTLRSLCVSNRLPLPDERSGNALNHVARYRVQSELPGVVPSMEYAHMPRIVDRELVRLMLEDPEDGFGGLLVEMRKAYLRNMSSFSPAHIYESFSLAVRRSRVGALWCQSNVRCAATVAATHPRTARKWRHTRETFCPNHPLDGVSQAVRLQHADLLRHWDSYESAWLADTAKTTARESGSALNGTKAEVAVGKRCDSCPPAATAGDFSSFNPYSPSQAVKLLFSEATARAPELVSTELVTGCRTQDVADPSRVQSLVLDVHHHVSTRDRTFRFFIVEDLQRLAIVLSNVEHMVSANEAAAQYARNVSGSHPGFDSSDLPLFITVNDDLDGDVLDRQMRTSKLVGWNESLLTEVLLRRVLWLSSYMAPKAPWERESALTANHT